MYPPEKEWPDLLKYIAAASALKFFSVNGLTKRMYRSLGNVVGSKIRQNASDFSAYLTMGELLVALCEKYNVRQNKFLEIGTGWLHWYSLYLKLFHDAEITMFDAWDNRQFSAITPYFSKLKDAMPEKKQIIDQILTASDFDSLYKKFNLKYIVDEKGMDSLPDNSYDLVFSFHVLEHVKKNYVTELTQNIQRILKPGGYSIHQIGIGDHLYHYDSKTHPMNYLRYSDRTWRLFFENDVQYINRILLKDWLRLFEKAGLTLMEKLPELVDIDTLPIHPHYSRYDRESLSAVRLTIVHKKT